MGSAPAPRTTDSHSEVAAGSFRHIIPKQLSISKGPHIVSLLTRYRPNFCAACGNKIIHLRWHLWTSRRFCNSCLPNFRKEHWLQSTLAFITLLSFGIVLGRAMRPPAPPLIIQRNVVAASGANNSVAVQAPASLPADDVYICGARTKKGTPCSRRVHGEVRCWQHKGMPAMLPTDKLRIKE